MFTNRLILVLDTPPSDGYSPPTSHPVVPGPFRRMVRSTRGKRENGSPDPIPRNVPVSNVSQFSEFFRFV